MIAYEYNGGVAIIIPTGEIPLEDVIQKDVPPNTEYIIVTQLPTDRFFRSCWVIQGDSVVEDLTMSREFSHNIRRQRRDAEFAPYDRLVTVPGQEESAESNRVEIRTKYDVMQTDIDSAVSTTELKQILNGL